MNYALQTWDMMVSTILSPQQLHPTDPEHLQQLTALSAKEKDRLRVHFMQHFYATGKQKKMEFYVQFNQSVLIKLMDKLYGYKQQSEITQELSLFYDRISSHLSFILDLIEEYFGKYFDRTVNVPSVYLDISCKEIERQLPALFETLDSRKEIPAGLSEILLKNFNSFCNSSRSRYSYNDLIFQKKLLKELLDLKHIPNDVPAIELVHELLVYMNFNDPAFLRYYLEVYAASIQHLNNTRLKLEKLRGYENALRLQPERPGSVLRPGSASAKSSLLFSLEHMAAHLKDSNTPSMAVTTSTAYPKELVSVPFRGAEIYLLHKSFIDAGGAPQEIYKSLLEKTAGYLGNKTQKGFSADSLAKYSDKVDPESKDTVKRFLQKMIRNIESYD